MCVFDHVKAAVAHGTEQLLEAYDLLAGDVAAVVDDDVIGAGAGDFGEQAQSIWSPMTILTPARAKRLQSGLMSRPV